MAVDKLLKEDGDKLLQEDGSFILLAPPDVTYVATPPPRVVLDRRLIVSVIVLPLLGLASGTADGAPTLQGAQLTPAPVVQYVSTAGPFVSGDLSWVPRTPDPVRSRVSVQPVYGAPPIAAADSGPVAWLPRTREPVRAAVAVASITVAPFTEATQQSTSLGWLPRTADLVPRPVLTASLFAGPGIDTTSTPQNVTWWPKFPDRLVLRVPFIAPVTADAPIAPSLPSAADAMASQTGPMVWSRGVVHYQAITGPVFPAAAAGVPDRSLQFNDDGLIRPDRWSHYQSTSGPVAIPLEISWLPRALEPVRVRVANPSVYTAPPNLTTSAPQNVTWGPRLVQDIRPAPRLIVSVQASPVRDPGAPPEVLFWYQPPPPLVRRLPDLKSLIVLPVSATASAAQNITWWSRNDYPVQRERRTLPSVVAKPTSDPQVPTIEFWYRPPPDLIYRKVDVKSVIVTPVPDTPRMAWLMPSLPLVVAKPITRQMLVVPATVPASAFSNLPWLMPVLPLVRAIPLTRHQATAIFGINFISIPSFADVLIRVGTDDLIVQVRADEVVVFVRRDDPEVQL